MSEPTGKLWQFSVTSALLIVITPSTCYPARLPSQRAAQH